MKDKLTASIKIYFDKRTQNILTIYMRAINKNPLHAREITGARFKCISRNDVLLVGYCHNLKEVSFMVTGT